MKKIIATLIFAIVSISAFGGIKLDITYGPWVENVTDDGFTVVWITPQNTMCWVEVAPDDGTSFYEQVRPQFYESVGGRRTAGTVHSIRVSGLNPGQAYRYKLYGKVELDNSEFYAIAFSGPRSNTVENRIRTLDSNSGSCRFTMVNDIHQDDAKFRKLMDGVTRDNTDFIVMNGDIVSAARSVDTVIKHTFVPIAEQVANIPVVFARGNHESRGEDFYKLPSLFPTPTGEFYYTFRQGPVAFVVLDAGEDKPDSDVEYSGTADFDRYREAEAEWLKKAVKDPMFASAKYKVAIIHIPTINEKDSWYGQKEASRLFLQTLNEAGIDLMLSGHLHKYLVREKGTAGNSFPIVVNSNTERLDFEADQNGMKLRIYDMDGKLVHKHDYK